MSEQRFIGYIQEPQRVLVVLVLTYEERLFVIRFSRVRSTSIRNVDGMRLYSLSEMHATPPFRSFVFVDWEETSNRHCEVVARDIVSTEMTEDFVPKEAIVHLRNLFPKQH